MDVIIPEKKKSGNLGKLGAVAGLVTTGTPQGAMAGYSAGNALEGATAKAQPQTVATGGSAMSRRVQSNDTLKQLRDAQSAVTQLPPEQQQQYAAPINQAYAMEAKRRGIA